MDEEVTKLLLSGITQKEFVAFYLMGVTGIVVRFLADLWYGIRMDRNTPYHFQWSYFLKGFLRVVMSLIVMAFVVARFQEFSHLLVDINFPNPTRVSDGNVPVAGITAGSAFLLGLGLDEVLKKLVGLGDRVTKRR